MDSTQQELIDKIQVLSKKYGYESYTSLLGYYISPLKGNTVSLFNNFVSHKEKVITVKDFEIILRKKLKETFEHKPLLKKEYAKSKFFHVIL